MNNGKKFTLQFKHKDFVCKQLAVFQTYRQVAQELLKEFPELSLSVDEALTVLGLIGKEIDDLSLFRYAPPVRFQDPPSSDQIIDTIRKQLKNLDITFGLK